MTPDELESLVLESKSGAALQKAFAALDDAQRKKLSTTAQKLYTQLHQNRPDKDASDRLKTLLKHRKGDRWQFWNSRECYNAVLAMFAVCPVSSLKREFIIAWNESKIFSEIIAARRPEWIDEWIEFDLNRQLRMVDFPMLRAWIKNGVCKKPTSDAYYVMFESHYALEAVHWNAKKKPPPPPISERLIRDPDLLEDVWGLFRVANSAFHNSDGLVKHAPDNYETWPQALIKLSQTGYLDRRRLLDAAVEALSAELSQLQLSGLIRFHKSLRPVSSELSIQQEEFLTLLSHQAGPVRKFAVDMLAKIDKDGELNDAKFLKEVTGLFLLDGKSVAVTALRLVKRVLKRRPKHPEDALRTAAEALRSSHTDIQEQAINLLKDHTKDLSGELKELLVELSGFVPASVASKLHELTGVEFRDSKIDPAGESLEYSPISGNILDHAIFPTVEPLHPIETADELIALASHAVEIVENPDVIEQLLDGISRLGNAQGSAFKEESAPLLHRIQNGRVSEGSNGILGFTSVQRAVTDLVLVWLTGEHHNTPKHNHYRDDVSVIHLVSHIRAITDRVAQGVAAPLFSAPTHTGGWIDPRVWVQRLLDGEARRLRSERLDICLSMLRLTPDGRREAAAQCKKLSGPYARVAKFALGGEANLSRNDRDDFDLWISAARCRDPYADWTEFFAMLGVADSWPNSLKPAEYLWRAYTSSETHFGQLYTFPRLDIHVEAAGAYPPTKNDMSSTLRKALHSTPATDWKRLPSVAMVKRIKREYFGATDIGTTWVAQWLPYTWPLCPDSAAAVGVSHLISRIDENSSSWDPAFGHLSALFQKNRPWSEMGHLLLCIGLIGKDADSRGLAIDALVEGIDSRQFDPATFASILSKLSKGGWIKLNRLGDNLMLAIHTSPLHAMVVADCLQQWIAQTDLRQRNLFRILEVLLEALSALGRTLSPETCEALGRLKGNNKTAKLASRMIASSLLKT